MLNALSIDLEDWYHICGVDRYSDSGQWAAYESRILGNTEKILRLLRDYNVKATFFALGYIAYREPDLIRKIADEGHEIGTHGFCHRRVFEMTEQEFEEDVEKSITAISSAAEARVLGFRAPEWSIRSWETSWALRVLRKLGILYDSSMVPLTRMGSRKFPLHPFPFETPYGEIMEFPLTTMKAFWENLPFTGGLPLRLTPFFYIVSKIERLNRAGRPAIVYIHPWEFDNEQPRIDLPFSRRFMHYFNIRSTPRKVEGLLRNIRFAPVREVLGLG